MSHQPEAHVQADVTTLTHIGVALQVSISCSSWLLLLAVYPWQTSGSMAKQGVGTVSQGDMFVSLAAGYTNKYIAIQVPA